LKSATSFEAIFGWILLSKQSTKTLKSAHWSTCSYMQGEYHTLFRAKNWNRNCNWNYKYQSRI